MSDIAALCPLVKFNRTAVQLPKETIDALREARIIEWNHTLLAWQPAADGMGFREANWLKVLETDDG